MKIILKPKQITRFFSGIVIFLTLAQIAGQFSTYVLGYDNIFGIIPMFTLSREQNIPSLYATLSLLFCAILLGLIAFAKKKSRGKYFYHWLGLSSVFVYLSIDEAVALHESTTVPLRRSLNTEGAFFYAWIIPYGIALLILTLVYLKFIIALPRKTRYLFIIAGLIYVAGAIGMEVIGGIHDDDYGRDNLIYAVYSTIEEVLEMTGIVIFIYTLLSYIQEELKGIRIDVSPAEAS